MSEEALRKHPGLGSLLKGWRRQVRLTQQEVADAVSARSGRDMTPNWYAKLENRDNAYPSDDDLDHILAVLGRTRWEAEQALGGTEVAQLDAVAAASPEPPARAAWSADVAAGSSAFMAAPPSPAAAAPPPPGGAPPAAAPSPARESRILRGASGHSEPADADLREALRRFGLSDGAAEEALAYARSLRARSERGG